MLFARAMRAALTSAALTALAMLTCATAQARPEYAAKESVDCLYCHEQPGQARNFRGLYYAAHSHSFAAFDNTYEAKAAGVKPDSKGEEGRPTVSGYPNVKVAPVLDFTMKDIDGKPVKLARYQGDVILLINVASLCGNTPQYTDLEKIYEKYKEKGFTILAFPANDFLKQEPGSNKEIKEFCTSKYNVTFPLFSKIVVKGPGQAPLYKYLTDKKTDSQFGGDIDWNFAKFLVNRQGELVARFPAGTDPMKPEVIAAIEKELDAASPDGKQAAEKTTQ
jgi:glutathione peroxidase